jgi:CheY-like chemotaxis protein
MPKLTGYEVATQARSAAWGSEITLIALTGWGQESDRNAALGAGFDSHFVKPVDSDAILLAIQSRSAARQARARDAPRDGTDLKDPRSAN